MAKTKSNPAKPAVLKKPLKRWIDRVSALADDVARWSETEHWPVERHQKVITEGLLGTYTLPELSIRVESGEILFVPIGLNVVGGNGRVDLEAIPTLARVKLIASEGDDWTLYADTNVPLRIAWNQKNFVRLVKDLLG